MARDIENFLCLFGLIVTGFSCSFWYFLLHVIRDQFKFILISFLLLLAPQNRASNILCKDVISSAPVLSQLDRQLAQEFWKNGSSQICGPVCIVNFLSLSGKIQVQSSDELIPLLRYVLTHVVTSIEQLDQFADPLLGLNSEILAKTLENISLDKNLGLNIQSKQVYDIWGGSEQEIKANDLFSAPHKRTSIITVNGGKDIDSALSQPNISHAVLVVDFNPVDMTVLLVDPFKPAQPLAAKLIEIKRNGVSTYIVEYIPKPYRLMKGDVFIIQSLVIIDY